MWDFETARGPEWLQTEHRIEARNTTRAEPSLYRPAGKIAPICLIVHAIDR
jgi:hypothetical protein